MPVLNLFVKVMQYVYTHVYVYAYAWKTDENGGHTRMLEEYRTTQIPRYSVIKAEGPSARKAEQSNLQHPPPWCACELRDKARTLLSISRNVRSSCAVACTKQEYSGWLCVVFMTRLVQAYASLSVSTCTGPGYHPVPEFAPHHIPLSEVGIRSHHAVLFIHILHKTYG